MNLHDRVKIKLEAKLKEGLPKNIHGEPFLKLKNGKRVCIRKSFSKYVVDLDHGATCTRISNNFTIDQLVDYLIEEGKNV